MRGQTGVLLFLVLIFVLLLDVFLVFLVILGSQPLVLLDELLPGEHFVFNYAQLIQHGVLVLQLFCNFDQVFLFDDFGFNVQLVRKFLTVEESRPSREVLRVSSAFLFRFLEVVFLGDVDHGLQHHLFRELDVA